MVSYPGSPGVHSGPLDTRSGRPWQMMDARLWRFSSRRWAFESGGVDGPMRRPLRHNQPVLGANDTAAAPYCREAVVHRAVSSPGDHRVVCKRPWKAVSPGCRGHGFGHRNPCP